MENLHKRSRRQRRWKQGPKPRVEGFREQAGRLQKTHLEVFRAKDENGRMKTPLALSVSLLLTACLAMISPAIAGSDDQAIIAATKKCLAAKSYPADMKITVERVEGDYARVGVEPKKKDMDGATAFLKREHGTWKGLTIGTGWDPADLDKLHIPKSLRP
jgi:hypothetical protein